MTETIDVTELSEQERVDAWRFEELTRLGLDAETAQAVALMGDVDLHEVERLVARGCAVDTAVRILA